MRAVAAVLNAFTVLGLAMVVLGWLLGGFPGLPDADNSLAEALFYAGIAVGCGAELASRIVTGKGETSR